MFQDSLDNIFHSFQCSVSNMIKREITLQIEKKNCTNSITNWVLNGKFYRKFWGAQRSVRMIELPVCFEKLWQLLLYFCYLLMSHQFPVFDLHKNISKITLNLLWKWHYLDKNQVSGLKPYLSNLQLGETVQFAQDRAINELA